MSIRAAVTAAIVAIVLILINVATVQSRRASEVLPVDADDLAPVAIPSPTATPPSTPTPAYLLPHPLHPLTTADPSPILDVSTEFAPPTPTPRPRPSMMVAKPLPTPTPKPRPACCYWPVHPVRINQGYWSGHDGIDFGARYGARIHPIFSGRVTFSGWKDNGGGWQVWVARGNRSAVYAHMRSRPSVGRGAYVTGGRTTIGRVGATGHATGPHLHVEVWIGGTFEGHTINPLSLLR